MFQVPSSTNDTGLDSVPLTRVPLEYVMDPNHINTVVCINTSFLIVSPGFFQR